MRVLTVDVGNTSVYAALFEGGRVRARRRLSTAGLDAPAARALGRAFRGAEGAIIGSVVPEAGSLLRRELPRGGAFPAFLVGKDVTVPIVNRYRRPRQVGADRLLNALAAYDAHRRACIVVDFGTAITFDVVSAKGEYLGGVIAPGIELSLESLFRRTALLPRIRLRHPSSILGRDTAESIRAGCTFGIGGLCERIVAEIIARHRFRRPAVLATGGYAAFMRRYCPSVQSVDPELTVRGLLLTFRSIR